MINEKYITQLTNGLKDPVYLAAKSVKLPIHMLPYYVFEKPRPPSSARDVVTPSLANTKSTTPRLLNVPIACIFQDVLNVTGQHWRVAKLISSLSLYNAMDP